MSSPISNNNNNFYGAFSPSGTNPQEEYSNISSENSNCCMTPQHPPVLPQMATPSPPHSAVDNGVSHSSNGTAEHSQHGAHRLGRVKSLDTCRVCGDGPARHHYGVPTCFGCKGFFRRTLKRTKEYTCRYNGSCVVDRYERNSCRYCRFKRCLEVGMDPKAVRPDRDAAGRSHPIRHRRTRGSLGELAVLDEENGDSTDDWIRKLPVDMRTLLMQIMNIEVIMRYEPYRQVQGDELISIAHRRLIAVIDMVDHLCVLMDLHNLEDKIALVKAAYAPLALFCAVAATSKVTKSRDMLCLCLFGYVPRGAHNSYEEGAYHFANRLVDRTLDELVEPFRAFNFKEQEVILMKAILTLNPHIRSLSTEAAEQVADLRDRIQETLYNVVRESHPKEVASSRFGNLLLFLPNVMLLGNVMYENLQFIQSFGKQHIDPLLGELLDNIEPMQDLNGVSLDDVLSLSDQSDSYMKHSQSASSISSMTSHESTTSSYDSNNYDPSYYTNGRRASMSQIYDSNRLNIGNAQSQSFDNQQVSQQSQMTSADSDPDYNVTLTADNFSGMRQAINQSMEIDQDNHPTSPEFYQQQQAQQPIRFFIDSNGGGVPLSSQCSMNGATTTTSHTAVGARHIFKVETTKDTMTYNNAAGGPFNGTSVAFQQNAFPAPAFSQSSNMQAATSSHDNIPGLDPNQATIKASCSQSHQQLIYNHNSASHIQAQQAQSLNNANAMSKSQSYPYGMTNAPQNFPADIPPQNYFMQQPTGTVNQAQNYRPNQ
ncbi:zinc finger, c4 type (two domains) domain-containing protein [Ditylenchus destructor]|nr:zinc finger, c4 type (two domains) domain-containing protein [Ditylenchus destructor]